jgi:hypothetical protein
MQSPMLKRYKLRKAAQEGAPEAGCIELLLQVRSALTFFKTTFRQSRSNFILTHISFTTLAGKTAHSETI